MPTYDYACELCGHKMEVFQSILAERLVNCPSCTEDGLKRLIGTGAGLIFKGTGFYETDYKKKTGSSGGGESGSSDKKSGTSSSGEGSSTKAPAEPSKSTTATAAPTNNT